MNISTYSTVLTALNSVESNNDAVGVTTSRLSSGLQVTSAADNPYASMVNSQIQTQLKGMATAATSTQNAISAAKTADNGLQNVSGLLEKLRTIAVSAANTAVFETNGIEADQNQVTNILSALNQLTGSVAFGSTKLLDGSAGLTASPSSSMISNLNFTGKFNGAALSAGPITLSQTTPASAAAMTLSGTFSSASSLVGAGNFTINGYAFATTATTTLSSTVSQINALSSSTGVTASIVASGSSSSIKLTQNTTGSQFGVNFSDNSSFLNGGHSASANGTNSVAQVSVTTSNGVQTENFYGGTQAGDSGQILRDSNGNAITISPTALSTTAAAQVGLVSGGVFQVQTGANANQVASLDLPTITSNTLGDDSSGSMISGIDVTSQAGAESAIKVIDGALNQVDGYRGQIGAFQADVLQGNLNSLSSTQTNLATSSSNLVDADMAQETTSYSSQQVMLQASISILAQANQQAMKALDLIRQG